MISTCCLGYCCRRSSRALQLPGEGSSRRQVLCLPAARCIRSWFLFCLHESRQCAQQAMSLFARSDPPYRCMPIGLSFFPSLTHSLVLSFSGFVFKCFFRNVVLHGCCVQKLVFRIPPALSRLPSPDSLCPATIPGSVGIYGRRPFGHRRFHWLYAFFAWVFATLTPRWHVLLFNQDYLLAGPFALSQAMLISAAGFAGPTSMGRKPSRRCG